MGILGSQSGVRLLPPDSLVKTSEVDQAHWNYRRLLGPIQRRRFEIVGRLMAGNYSRLLEVGFGSGVFLPELASRCDELHGVDPHGNAKAVSEVLARHGISAHLARGAVEHLPYPDQCFDAVVSVSALEFADDVDAACTEVHRVLKPDGELVLCTPSSSLLADLALRLATGQSPTQYGDRRERLESGLRQRFTSAEEIMFPSFAGRILRLYTGLRLQPSRHG